MKKTIQIKELSSEQIEDIKKQIYELENQPKFIWSEIKTFDDAYRVASEKCINEYKQNMNASKHFAALAKLELIIDVVNEGWTPNFTDIGEYKYYPFFEFLSSGCRFSGTDYDFTHTGTDVGSRLCFSSREKAEFVGRQFIELYNDYLLM